MAAALPYITATTAVYSVNEARKARKQAAAAGDKARADAAAARTQAAADAQKARDTATETARLAREASMAEAEKTRTACWRNKPLPQMSYSKCSCQPPNKRP